MEDPAEKIIVFEAFDTAVQANLAKTKLDAYGIPCFLTEENFTSLYPLRNQIFPGVRLHIFEKDSETVKEIMRESPFETEPTLCPHCNSKNVTIEDVENPNAILAVISFTGKKVYHCHDCGKEWD